MDCNEETETMAYGEAKSVGGQMAGTTAPGMRNMAENALEEALKLEERLRDLVDRIEPAPPVPVSDPKSPGGMIEHRPGLSLTMSRLEMALSRCHGEIGRLSDRL
jgi:hypothetical protein